MMPYFYSFVGGIFGALVGGLATVVVIGIKTKQQQKSNELIDVRCPKCKRRFKNETDLRKYWTYRDAKDGNVYAYEKPKTVLHAENGQAHTNSELIHW